MRIKGTKTVPGIVDIICDRCKQSCKIHAFNEPDGSPGYHMSYATIQATFPYGSPKDGEHHRVDLCEPCYDWLKSLLEANEVRIGIAEYDFFTGESSL